MEHLCRTSDVLFGSSSILLVQKKFLTHVEARLQLQDPQGIIALQHQVVDIGTAGMTQDSSMETVMEYVTALPAVAKDCNFGTVIASGNGSVASTTEPEAVLTALPMDI